MIRDKARASSEHWCTRCSIWTKQTTRLWHKHPYIQYLQVLCFILSLEHCRFIAQKACISRDIQWQPPCSETWQKYTPCFVILQIARVADTYRLVTLSLKVSSNFSHELEVASLSYILLYVLSTASCNEGYCCFYKTGTLWTCWAAILTLQGECHANATVSKNCNIHLVCSIRKFALSYRVSVFWCAITTARLWWYTFRLYCLQDSVHLQQN